MEDYVKSVSQARLVSRDKRAYVLDEVYKNEGDLEDIIERVQDRLGRKRYRKNPEKKILEILEDLEGFGMVEKSEEIPKEDQGKVSVPGPATVDVYSVSDKGEETLRTYIRDRLLRKMAWANFPM